VPYPGHGNELERVFSLVHFQHGHLFEYEPPEVNLSTFRSWLCYYSLALESTGILAMVLVVRLCFQFNADVLAGSPRSISVDVFVTGCTRILQRRRLPTVTRKQSRKSVHFSKDQTTLRYRRLFWFPWCSCSHAGGA
jgi:hypothetical protein